MPVSLTPSFPACKIDIEIEFHFQLEKELLRLEEELKTKTYQPGDYATGFTQNANVLAIQNLAIQNGSQVNVSSVRELTKGANGAIGEQEMIVLIFDYLASVLNVNFVDITGNVDGAGQPVRNADIRFGAAALAAAGISARKANGATKRTTNSAANP